MKNKFITILLLTITLFVTSCASEGSSASSGTGYIPYNPNSSNASDPSNSNTNTNTDTDNSPNYIRFRISVPGEIKGSLYYCILLNTEGNPIQVDDIGTYTDVIRICVPDSLDAPRYNWFHRLNEADRILTSITDLTNYVSYSSDKSTVFVMFPLKESSVFKNQIQGASFTTQAVITTSEKEMGKFIDTIGPDLSSCTHYSFMVNPASGVVSSSLPSGYPNDSLNDYEESNIPSDTPNENADLMLYSVDLL